MKSFRTEVKPAPSTFVLTLATRVFTLGSCFSDAIGRHLEENKFSVLSNPFGALYDPLSIHKSLSYVLHNESPLPSTYAEHDGLWSNFDFHSSLSGLTRNEAEKNVSNSIGAGHHFLKETGVLIITYGTARIHERKDTGEPVANCHKLPGTLFQNYLLTPDQIVSSFSSLHQNLIARNHGLKVILTVSPVRHTRETIEGNSISKSILRWSCHRIQHELPGVLYFPSYEIMMDDLRDYRFYQPDMIHPSAEAIDYIWEKFSDHYFDSPTRELLRRWQSVLAALRHRPFHGRRDAHQRFLSETLQKLEELKSLIPVEEEIRHIRSQMTLPYDA